MIRPSALDLSIRKAIGRRRLDGLALSRVALELGLSYHSARQIWPASRRRGGDGLTPRYQSRGRRPESDPIAIRARELKKLHPGRGAQLIRVGLAKELGIALADLPAVRTLQLAFRAAKVHRPGRPRGPRTPPSPRATRVHEAWQVDAVEKAGMRDGSLASWLAVVDEAGGALLDLQLSPPAAVARDHIRRGPRAVPRRVRPLGPPRTGPDRQRSPPGLGSDLPTDLAPWLIGLGVVPEWDPARQPRLNPKVERDNGATQRRVEVGDCPDLAALKDRLAWAGQTQRELYPALAGRTRLEAYPGLTRILRPYSLEAEPTLWEMSRVDASFAGRLWRRRADRYGSIWLSNRGHGLGQAHAGKEVDVRFDPQAGHRVVTEASDDGPVARLIAPELTRGRILSLTVSHRRPPREKRRRNQGPSTSSAT